MAVSDTISVTISVQDAAPTVASFGTPLILAKHGNFLGGKQYVAGPSGLSAMVTDGFTVNDRAYHIAQAITAQSPHCEKFYVYERLTGGNSQSVVLTPTTTTELYVHTFTVQPTGQAVKTTITYTNGAAETATTIATALHALVNAVTGVTSVDGTGFITVTPTTADTFVYIDGVDGNHMTVADGSSDAGVATDLAQAAVDLGENFYGVILDSFSDAEIQAAAAWCLSNSKILAGQSVDTDIVTGSSTDTASDLQTATNHNAYVLYSRFMSGDPAAGLMGRQFSKDPGSSSWNFKAIAGATADNLAETEYSFGDGKNAMLYISEKGVNHTTTGRAASGRLLSTTRGVAWLKARIGEAVFQVFATREKMGFDKTTLAVLRAAVSGVLVSAEDNNFILPAGDPDFGWTVTMTALTDVTTTEKAAGLYDGIAFHAVLTGEVEKVVVDGTITL